MELKTISLCERDEYSHRITDVGPRLRLSSVAMIREIFGED